MFFRRAPAAPARASPRDELARQRLVLVRELPTRLAAIAMVYGLSAVFLPLWVAGLCALASLTGEIVSLRMLRDSDRLMAQAGRFWLYVLSIALLELAYATPPALIWQLENPYTKALAVGMIYGGLLNVVTVRAIYRPTGFVGVAAVATMTLGSNTLYWLWHWNPASLALSTAFTLLALWHSLMVLIANSNLHREAAAGRAEALAANAAKSRFLAQISHELRTPLNAILGMGHAELHRVADPVSHERLAVMIAAASGLATLLDDILDLSAAEAGRLPVRPIAADPAAEIAATLALFRPSIEAAGLTLDSDLAPDLPAQALFDPVRLRQCLSNLLSNALKNTPAGGIGLRARVLSGVVAASLPRRLQITITDTGPGISADQWATIFAPPGPDKSPALAPGGHGLGLAICRALARQMGGDLTLAPAGPAWPAAGNGPRGAAFVLTLALPPPPEGLVAQTLPAPDAAQMLPGRRVLVVDDIATNRLVAITYLRLLGAVALEAASGPKALHLLATAPVDLVLLDLNMPGMDGPQTLRQIRALPGPAAALPVIALTAAASEADRAACRAGGFDGYLAKPMTPDAMAAELTRFLPAGDARAARPPVQ